ncbi:MAG: hydrogenase [Deltaproteobacteria bacterium]|nr:hydrogenase [Deltaproteobacteria bacterium]
MNPFFFSLLCIVLGGPLALLFHNNSKFGKLLPVMAISGGSLGGLVTALQHFTAPQPPTAEFLWLDWFPLAFRLDPLSAFFLVPVFGIALLAAIYSFDYLDNPAKGLRTAANYFFFSLLIAAMGLVVCADNILALALAWELMSIASCFLVLYDYELKENRQAAYIFFIFTQAGAMFLFAAFGLLYAQTGSVSLAAAAGLSDGLKLTFFLLCFIGFGSKAGIFPLHIWLPHAHSAAPSHISAFMSGVMIKMGIYGIVRFYFLLNVESVVYGQIVLFAGIISGVLGIIYAAGQNHIKRMLAYSSIENIGIILIGMGMGMLGAAAGKKELAFWCFTGALLHVLNHAIFKSLLFMGAGSVIHGTGTAAIDRLGGLMKGMKFTGIAFLTGALSICALPPFNGFVSEFLIYSGAFSGSSFEGWDFILAALAIVSLAVIGGLALLCFTKAVGTVFLGEPRTVQAEKVHECGRCMRLSMTLLACFCLVIGLFPAIVVEPLAAVTGALLKTNDIPMGDLLAFCDNITLGAILFLGLTIVLMILRSWLYRGKQVDAAPTWGCGFTRATPRIQYTGTSFAAPALEFFGPVAPLREEYTGLDGPFPKPSSYQSKPQDLAEETATIGVALPIFRALKRLRWIQHGNIQLYIAYIVVAIILSILITFLV